jgi:hypothetical protein
MLYYLTCPLLSTLLSVYIYTIIHIHIFYSSVCALNVSIIVSISYLVFDVDKCITWSDGHMIASLVYLLYCELDTSVAIKFRLYLSVYPFQQCN